jgi:DNA-binding transcriptional ArsR family regulator
MKSTDALVSLSALAQESRLELFRRLVRAGPTGLAVGDLRTATGLPGATLTNHLNVLRQSGLVESSRAGRTIRCRARYDRMDELVAYLLENCCAGEACVTPTTSAARCVPTPKPGSRRPA